MPAFVNQIGREEKKPAAQNTADQVVKKALPAACYIGFVAQLIYGLGYGAFDNSLSLAAVETGTITTVQAAAIASWGGIASLIGGFFFGFMKGKIGNNIGWLSLVMNIIGFAVVGLTSSTTMWYIGVTICKVGFCWWMPYTNFLVNDGTDESNSALATSLGFFGNSFGAFIFAYVLAFVGNMVGGITQHQAFFYGCAWIGIALVLIAFNHFKNYKHYQEIA